MNMIFTRHRVAAAGFSLCLAACFATPAFAAGQAGAPPAAQPGPGGPGPHGVGEHGPGMPGPGMPSEGGQGEPHDDLLRRLQRLNLSEAQRDKLFAILHAAAPERREHAKAIHKAHEALRELGRAERFDEARANVLSRELGQAVAAEALLHVRTEARLLAVLTPEQREQLHRHRTPGPQLRPGQPGWEERQGPQGHP